MPEPKSSAAYRIAFAYAAAFALGIALLGAAVFYAIHISFVRELDMGLTEQAASLRGEYSSGGNPELAEAIAKREAADTRDLSAYGVFSASGERLYGSINATMPRLGFEDIAIRDHKGRYDTGRSLAIQLEGGERLIVATDLEPVEQVDRTILTIFAAGFAGVITLGFAGALVLGGYLRRRLEKLSLSASTIIAGDTSHRMPVSARSDEFDQLAGSLNAMLDRNESLLNNLQQVSGDVAHDLRTPLTRLRNQLDAGQQAVEPDTKGGAIISGAIEKVDEILALFAAILRISEIEGGQLANRFEKVNLSELVNEIAESYAPAIEDQGRTLVWAVEAGITASVDRDLIAQALVNLVENAQRHTPAGSAIAIKLSELSPDIALLTVVDDGPGVAEADWARITKRFVRLDRSRSTSGYGLGLNLVAAVARMHGGNLTFADNGPGLVASITIPRA